MVVVIKKIRAHEEKRVLRVVEIIGVVVFGGEGLEKMVDGFLSLGREAF